MVVPPDSGQGPPWRGPTTARAMFEQPDQFVAVMRRVRAETSP
ncbi:hypothetical protein ACFQX7_14375 [Luedemannella flava]